MRLDVVNVSGDRASLRMRGFSPAGLRRRAVRGCSQVFGIDGGWRFTREEIVPCLVSPGGRVRLYEGRFDATRSRGVSSHEQIASELAASHH
jgi:hypothetical protein